LFRKAYIEQKLKAKRGEAPTPEQVHINASEEGQKKLKEMEDYLFAIPDRLKVDSETVWKEYWTRKQQEQNETKP
jgi:hypothetical protein